jgi:hypothetical protein
MLTSGRDVRDDPVRVGLLSACPRAQGALERGEELVVALVAAARAGKR